MLVLYIHVHVLRVAVVEALTRLLRRHLAEVEQTKLQLKLKKQDQMKKQEESDRDNFLNVSD